MNRDARARGLFQRVVGVASYRKTQFPIHVWYFSLQPIMTRDATRPKPVLTGAIQSINPCSQRRWQFVGLGTPTACQRKPKLSEIRIKLVILRFIDFTSFGNAPFGQISCYCQDQKSSSHDAVIRVYDDAGNVIETHEHKGDFKEW